MALNDLEVGDLARWDGNEWVRLPRGLMVTRTVIPGPSVDLANDGEIAQIARTALDVARHSAVQNGLEPNDARVVVTGEWNPPIVAVEGLPDGG